MHKTHAYEGVSRQLLKDACHIACAEMMHCDYLLTTDKRMLKYHDSTIRIINPIEFVKHLNDTDND